MTNNMIKAGLIGAALMVSSAAGWAQQAGSTTVVAVAAYKEVVDGWSIKKQLIGATVYNEEAKKVGKITDVIVAPDATVSYAIVSAGGFVGLGRHDVAVPIGNFKVAEEENKLVLPGATKDMIKGLPEFKYVPRMDRHL